MTDEEVQRIRVLLARHGFTSEPTIALISIELANRVAHLRAAVTAKDLERIAERTAQLESLRNALDVWATMTGERRAELFGGEKRGAGEN